MVIIWLMMVKKNWLVVKTPSWKMMEFVNGKDYLIYEMDLWEIKHVWNHQPVMYDSLLGMCH